MTLPKLPIENVGGESPEGGGEPPRPLSPATKRAYASDMQHLLSWCQDRGIPNEISDLDERRVFAYLVSLLQAGRNPATIRRRITALRSYAVTHGALGLAPSALSEIEKHVLEGRGGGIAVLVISDDPIIRAGIRAVLSESRVICWSDTISGADPATLTVWDYALVWVAKTHGLDRYDVIQRLRRLGSTVTTLVPIVAVYPGRLPPIVRLRLAEAGVRYAIPHAWPSDNLTSLSTLFAKAEIPQRFHLETPFALRERLGLNLDGDVASLLEIAARLPSEVWEEHLSQEHLPISRAQIQDLRRTALDVAGIPAPDFVKYASSLRAPPSTPEWGSVRDVVRRAFGLTEGDL